MKQIVDGCFALDEPMPCNPGDIRLWRWVLPSTLDHAEPEEAAARILHFSQQLDQWVGVSFALLVKMMREEFNEANRLQAARRHNREEERRHHEALVKYYLLSVVTLGLYALFVWRPTKCVEALPDVNLPFSGIFAFGPEFVIRGIRDLVKRDFLRLHTVGKGDNASDVFFPTPQLVTRIMEVQGIAAS